MSPRLTRLVAAIALLAASGGAAAQIVIPNYWDQRRRLERPALAGVATPIRILTAPDHPPFNFIGGSGELTGFNVELMRAACGELGLACTIQARDFDTLLPALQEGRGEVVAAGIAPTAALRQTFEVGEVYLRSPARFVVRKGNALASFEPEDLAGKRIAVEEGGAHAAFLAALMPDAVLVPRDAAGARAALRNGEVDALFGDAVALALWLNGAASDGCCEFRGGAFGESRYFGEGFALIFRPGGETLRRAFDHALQRLAERGVYAELYLRWFPVGLY